ncbi:MAG: signal peptide peptidase SppA [Paludibacteraceae bacterium]|nr:signal peptide peptidase SppA [Paludibacteraceae bacterium]
MKFFKTFLASLLALFLFSFLAFVLPIVALVVISFFSTSQTPEIPQGSVLQLNLTGELKDRQTLEDMPFNWLNESDYNVYFMDELSEVLKKAAGDSRIKGVSLSMGQFSAGFASVSELRSLLEEFRKSGKFVYAYSGAFSQKDYYLATAADTICINPVGTLDFKGISTSTRFYKGLLDKLGVEMQIIKVGAYKSFTEQFSSDSMSAENRSQSEILTRSIWNSILEEISEARNCSVEELNHYADRMLYFDYPDDLINKRMVDVVCYRDQYLELLKSRSGADQLELVKYKDYLAESSSVELLESMPMGDRLAVVFAEGEIDNGTSEGINSDKFEKMLLEIADDSAVRAVVLRVNSPGGSAYGAEQIWRAVQRVRQQKPIVVSMGDYAASGGYYISAGANYIVANPATITGSIGVFSVIPNLDSLSKKIGISMESVKTNENADFGNSIAVPLSDDMKQKLQDHTEHVYDIFLRRCADGRNLSIDSVKCIAEGRVWSGQTAYELGLVDKLGTLNDAIALAATKAGLSNYNIDYYPEKIDFMSELNDLFSVTQKKLDFGVVFSKEIAIFEQIRCIDRQQALIPVRFEIR